ncbi:probable inactive DNA (cytosine-5)-methyltransferase DRM3 [Durio zibethinus]|uniref:Probable inactive DNA (Cytosine-5)-methyltransferase DRM3 n=1 Tax=Durio zibethinus TaxID=66656 RepID=A0A6P6A7E9_DURZI|nr:probable inactive DNA (cytosine-5)-methyltransferase DRM3 [Durio zibethinus]XP_022760751.1 probable inactive DNA (cytosine-5)-methyltransferase DRM3 [Durio zibethinus]XP_022760752.1 probable inactive DNA (cytosine-5)-methyltransferase DRM3 [Durio zibethinus]
MSRHLNGKSSSSQEGPKAIVAKPEMLDFDFPEDALYSRHVGENVASSSGSNVRSFFVGMGFLPSLVEKVIQEKGEDNADLLLETLIEYSDVQKAKSQSSDYLNSLFGGKDTGSFPEISTYIQPKEEPDAFDEDLVDKRASLLMMHFSVDEVEFALEKLGEDAPLNELVDFISAAQIAEKLEEESKDSLSSEEEKDQNVTNETLFGTMEKTLRLLEMGFSENEVSIAIEKFGSEVPIAELADAMFTGHLSGNFTESKKFTSAGSGQGSIHNSYDTVDIKTEDCSSTAVPQSRNINLGESCKGKRPKEESFDDFPVSIPQVKQSFHEKKHKGKRPKQDYVDNTSSFLDPAWLEEKVDPNITSFEMPRAFKSNSCKSVDKMVAKPPYFFYGNVVNLSYDDWAKISQFLYGIEPEFVSTQLFSAFNRKEGYVHNLPAGNRFHILPKSPLTIQDAIPHTKKWWPSWDTRKQLSCTGSEVLGASKLCDRLGKTLADSRGILSSDQQKYILRQCQISNLIWIGPYNLSLAQPEHWEHILGYPSNHSQALENDLTQRLQLLQQSFQTDTLGYHLSVLKSIYPGGLTMLSVFSGIGGAVVALHRLGIQLKGVVSVETSEAKQRILRNWWHSTEQTGELVLIEDIQKLTIKRLEGLIDKLGGIDLVICQNSNMKGPDDDTLPGFDFTMFNEFVRVLQRVRSMMERRS